LNEKEITTKTRQMLLGRFADDERERFEAEFIGNEAMFDAVRAAEDEIVEQYAFGKLSDDESHAFETSYLSLDSGRRRLALTRSLIERSKFAAITPVTERVSLIDKLVSLLSSQRVAVSTGFALLAILVGGIWIANRKTDEIAVQPTSTPSPATTPQGRTPENIAPIPTPEIAEVPKETDKPKDQMPTPTPKVERVPIPMVALVAGSLRDGGKMPQLTIGKNADRALLNLKIDSNDYRSYAVQVVDPDGRVVSQARDLRGTKGRVSAAISTSKLVSGEYIVKLSGIGTGGELESLADFPLRINRK